MSGEQYRVFCPKHDYHAARYTDGRPVLDDTCPYCLLTQAATIIKGLADLGRLYDEKDPLKATQAACFIDQVRTVVNGTEK